MNERLQVRVLGIVQGVGFRPFVYRIATELELAGWIRNDENGVTLEVEGPHSALLQFLERLHRDKPPPAFLYAVDHRFLSATGYEGFEIRKSESRGSPLAWILPDLAICADCRRELFDSGNRRYRYPFINCTHCGTRFTIIECLPYDRPLTSMKSFRMCAECDREYHDPSDRRFHAQPNACPECGPQLEFRSGNDAVQGEPALHLAVQQIREGKILAVKGIGGFHLMLDARNEEAVTELRKRKKRQNKPLAIMYPDLESLKRHVGVPAFAEPLLQSAQAPILLLIRTKEGYEEIADSVAPQSPYLGVFLPYAPLHLLLLQDLGFPVIATSGNITEEPIEFQDEEAMEKLASICDGFLTHNRPIVHHADDSVLHIVTLPEAKPQMLRRARGYTPFPILAPRALPPMMALGGHMNATFALSRNQEIILSQHLGDLDGYESRVVYRQVLDDFLRLYEIHPQTVVHDLHPDYYTTRLAEELGLPRIAVQHHHAHLAACMLENQCEGRVLGLTWDGTGYGPDKTVWGGEFLLGDPKQFERVATLYPFRLPGGERSIKEPWRTALSLLWEAFGEDVPNDLPLFQRIDSGSIHLTRQILQKEIHGPVTTSMGRLFDGVSAILGLSYYNTHQAESAQLLEYAAWRYSGTPPLLPLPLIPGTPIRLDWRQMVLEIVQRFRDGIAAENLAASFHLTLVDAALRVAREVGMSRIAMAGGVFCNRYLTENMLMRFQEIGLQGFIHSQLPPTDGSIAAGQLWIAAHQL